LLALFVIVVAVVVVVVVATRRKVSSPQLPSSGNSNTLALVAFILAFFASVPAVVCGHVALSQISRTGDSGRGFAIAALWIGYIEIAVGIVLTVVFVFLAAHPSGPSFNPYH
jgi:hypothetical protein